VVSLFAIKNSDKKINLELDSSNGSLKEIELEWRVIQAAIHLILQFIRIRSKNMDQPISVKISLCEKRSSN
jgi:hypothetical protein